MRFISKSLLTTAVAAISAVPGAFAGTAYPSNYEQYMLELINRARANPTAEAARYPAGSYQTGVASLNEGLPAGTISTASKQPIAFNPNIEDAAQAYSVLLLANNVFDDYFSGTPSSRMQAAGYVFSPVPTGAGENLALDIATGPLPITAAEVGAHHAAIFVDSGVAGRGHRVNLMDPNWREMGVGIRTGVNYIYNGTSWNAVMTVEDFAFRGGNPFLTGVALHDADHDSFYTPGEGFGSISITATRTSDGQIFSTVTFPSGGYSLRVPAGTYNLTATGTGLGTVTRQSVVVASQNVKIDFVPHVPGDFNSDGHVDGVDYGQFQLCTTGPTVPQANVPCQAADLDRDGDVDQADFGVFQQCYTGPNKLGDPACAG